MTGPDWRLLVAVVAALAAVRIGVLAASGLGFHGDEAQYWSWSRDLAWGYFSKPPMVAWAIRGAQSVCGEAEWCARAASPLLHAGTSLLAAALAARLYGPRAGFWAGILYATLPGVAVSSAAISTDAPLLFFWTAALYALVRLLEGRSLGWAAALGLAAGCGLLSKYAMGYFLPCAVLACALRREHRWLLASRQGLLALAVAGAVLAPNVAWNLANGWATVAHVGANANLGGELFRPMELLAFLFSQAGVFGPLLLAALAWRTALLFRRRPDPREGWLLCFCLPILALVAVQALLSRANANWAAPAYVAATVALAGWAAGEGRLALAKLSVALHLAAAAVVSVYVLDLPGVRPPLESDPLRRMRGWEETAAGVSAAMRAHPGRTLLLDDRKTMAALLYYGRNAPWRPRMWDFDGRPDNHYELAARYRPRPGGRALLAARWNDPRIPAAFRTAVPAGEIRVDLGGGRERVLRLSLLDGHAGE